MLDKMTLFLEIMGGLLCCYAVLNTDSSFLAGVYTLISWIIGFWAGQDIEDIIKNNREDD